MNRLNNDNFEQIIQILIEKHNQEYTELVEKYNQENTELLNKFNKLQNDYIFMHQTYDNLLFNYELKESEYNQLLEEYNKCIEKDINEYLDSLNEE